jgi:hypothetical protein
MMLCRNLTAASYGIFTTGISSIHLMNVSIAMNKNLNPLGALGRIPTMSIPILQRSRSDRSVKEDLHALLFASRKISSHCT